MLKKEERTSEEERGARGMDKEERGQEERIDED